jgi:Tfp pilus assembly protein PilV
MLLKSERGYTIMEFVIASIVIGIVVLSLYGMFYGVTKINTDADNYTIATAAAEQILEEYRNTPYSSISVGTVDDTSSALAAYPSLLSPRSATATVTLVNASGIKQVDVTISWTGQGGAKSIELTTQIADIGLNR